MCLSNTWGNICRYSSFTNQNADVICHQMTYTGASSWSSASIDLFGIDNRTHNQDVHLRCKYNTNLGTSTLSTIGQCNKIVEQPYIQLVTGTVILTRGGTYSKSYSFGCVVVYRDP